MDTKKIFFAILPNPQARKAISRQINLLNKTLYQNSLKPVRTDNFHITLNFIGQAEINSINCLTENASHIKFEPFEITLDCTGLFHRARVLWLGSQNSSSALQLLHQNIVATSQTCKLPNKHGKFVPHLTIARKFKHQYEPLTFPAIKWQVDHFCLMESVSYENGVRYEILKKFQSSGTY